ncbi:muscle M-line assembly protein unc-89-like isoform X1 [Anguilla rostrata]|uniref:muscle M-line assembly protein unc-89-like isoform X1 n=1 Tax=Anguilla rostrata TaxID=7938 RepID=UPI0030D2BA00
MKTMLVCVWLVSSLIHMISGCSLSAPKEVTGYTRDSVVLPCYCTEGQPTPNTARWLINLSHSSIILWSYPNNVDDQYKDRVIISATPGNLSLRLSDLTLRDKGTYRCEADGNYRDISLTVKGCVLSDSKLIHITGFTGDSVVLPCACTDVQKKPEKIKWIVRPGDQRTIIFSQSPPSVNDRYKHRVQVLDSISPGNLSLHLSDLTLSDEGTYRCEADDNYQDISLTVKGCVLSDSEPIHITGLTGNSVVLPCACTDVQKKPEKIKWPAYLRGQHTVIFPPSVNDRYKHRVQVLDSISPGNLSLRLSDLTLSDGGTYWCEADGNYRNISLTVKGCVLSDSELIHITGFTGDSVVLPCACTDVQKKPEKIKWTAYLRGQHTIIFSQNPPSVNDHYKHRVQVLDSISPGNLSLRLSDLTLSDEGDYRCGADGNYRDIKLTVKAGSVLPESEPIHITGRTGDSVVLPCACIDVQRKPERVKWTAHPRGQSTVIFPQSPPGVNDRYKHRVQVLDSGSPGNLSLRLSDLTLSDEGTYRCEADGHYRYIRLTVKGCVLSGSKPIDITGFTGDSVILPCACTDVQSKPEKIKWTAHKGGQSTVIFPPSVNDRYKHRVQVLDSISPGNLSLRLSDLTLSDEGDYRCEADGHYRDIRLTVKGCSLSAPKEVTGYTRGSVVLPCYCTEGQPTLNSARWVFNPGPYDTTLWSYLNAVNNHYKDRVFISATPGNLTLRLSDLTPTDAGLYRCEASAYIYRDIKLTVKEGCVLSDSEPIHITGLTGESVVLPCGCIDVQRKPEWFRWTTHKGGQTIVVFPQLPANGGHYKDRVQVLNSISPGNMSLRLSDLTLSDGGTYRCEADGNYRNISLTVIHRFDQLCLKV